MPVPRPVTSPARPSGQRGDRAAARRGVGDAHVAGDQAAAPRRRPDRRPPRRRRRAPAAPRRRVMAGPTARSRGAGATLRTEQPGRVGQLARATPTSTTITSAPAWRAKHVDRGPAGEEVGDHLRGDLLRPRRDALGVDAVVAGEHRDRRGPGSGGGNVVAIPASCAPTASNRPSDPGGLVSWSWCCSARRCASTSSGACSSDAARNAPHPRRQPVEHGDGQGPGVVGDDQRPVLVAAGSGSGPDRDAATGQRRQQPAGTGDIVRRGVAPAAGRIAEGRGVDHDGIDGSGCRRAARRIGVGGHDRS